MSGEELQSPGKQSYHRLGVGPVLSQYDVESEVIIRHVTFAPP